LFGKPATPGGGFGSGATSSLFGAKPVSPFGAAQQPGPQPLPPVPTTGTLNPPYEPTWQKDPPAQPKPGEAAPPIQKDVPAQLFHIVSAMEPYRGASFEELRMLDYQNGKKKAEDAPANMGFGQQNAAGGFGQPATNTFGQSSNTFGAKPGGLFGSTPAAPTFGSFGQPAAQTGSSFGQPAAAQNTFGQTNTATGGMFGQPAAPQAGQSLFGNTANTFGQPQQQQPASTSTFSGFGAPKPAFGAQPTTNTFGQPASTAGIFGQPAAATGSTGLFGTQQPQAQPAQGMFGTTNNTFGKLFLLNLRGVRQ